MGRGSESTRSCAKHRAPRRDATRTRAPQPSAAISDSPSATTTEHGGAHSYDGGKKLNARQRHVLVDTHGLRLQVVVHPAGRHDRVGAKQVLPGLPADFPRLERIWADHGSAGALRAWTREQTGLELELVYPCWRHIKRYFPEMLEPLGIEKGFQVLPRRWVVERTFAWLGRYRRLSTEYERLCATTDTLIYIAMSRLLLRRLTAL